MGAGVGLELGVSKNLKKNQNFQKMAAAHNWIGKLGVKFQSAKSWRCDAADQNFLCVDVDTIYGYYQSRFGSPGPSYKGVPIPF